MMIDFDILWPKYGINPYGVLHLGGNTGQEATIYNKFKVGEVIWVEAIPEVFEQLSKNLEQYTGQSCLNICVGKEEGKQVVFNVSNNEAQSSSYLELGHHKTIHPEVHYVRAFYTTVRRLDNIFNSESFKQGEWFLNADLQGAELDAFEGLGILLKDFKWVYTEVNKNEVYEGCPSIDELDYFLLQNGFERVETGEWVADSWTDALYLKTFIV